MRHGRGLTRRGAAALVLGFILLAGGQWGGYPLLRALGAVLVCGTGAAMLVTARGLRVSVERTVYPDRIERGKPALARLVVRNTSGARQPGMLATDRAAGEARTIWVRELLSGAEATYHYELDTPARGRQAVGPLILHRSDPFGLARNRLPTGETAQMWVYPKQLPARALAAGHPRHHHEGAITDEALRGSIDLRDVREYVPGDDVRHLHWKATARTGTLMIRDLTDPVQPRFAVLLDTRSGVLPPAGFEEAIEAAASLLAASARAEHPSRLVTSSGLDLATSGGPRAARTLLDALCELGQSGAPADPLTPELLTASRSGGGSLAIVTAAGAELSALSSLKRRYTGLFVLSVAHNPQRQTGFAGVRILSAPTAAGLVRQWNEAAR